MASLAHAEIESLLRFVYDASTLERDVAVTPEIVQGLCGLVPSAEIVGYAELDWKRRRTSYLVDGLGAHADPDGDEVYWRLHRQHPVCEYFDRTGDLARDASPTSSRSGNGGRASSTSRAIGRSSTTWACAFPRGRG